MDEKPVKIQLSSDGVHVDFGTIKSIGIKNIFDLKSYHKSQVGDRIMHIIEFNDGGTCEVTYLINGTLELFEGTQIQFQLDPGNAAIIIGQVPKASDSSNGGGA